MRVIAGKYRGRQLVGFNGPHIRPTTDRVKETVFNILAPDIDGARVLDLFSGTGNLGIEALSRGAAWVDAVEQHPASLKIIRANLEKLGIEEGIRVHGMDVFKYLQRYAGQAYDVILIDPPFTQKWADRVMDELSRSAVFSDTTTVMIEASSQETVEKAYGRLQQYKERHFGDKIVFFFTPNEDSNDSGRSHGDGGLSG